MIAEEGEWMREAMFPSDSSWKTPGVVGDNPFLLIGGTGAFWIRAKERPGRWRLKAIHPQLGMQVVEAKSPPRHRKEFSRDFLEPCTNGLGFGV
jgi:hypothetical protein